MARVRPRSSRRRDSGLKRKLPALLIAAFCGGVTVGVALAGYRTVSFLHTTVNVNNPIEAIQQTVDPPQGSIAWKLKYGQQVNILALGYGGVENDAPWLTDTLMILSVDPASRRVMETSIPRDLFADIQAWPAGGSITEKINVAFEVGNEPDVWGAGALRPEFQGKDGAGHLVEATLSRLTSLQFDRYFAVDFKAFRDVVDALGGIDVHMTGSLDDCHYPDYQDGYLNGGVPLGYPCPPGAGIHFPAGDYHVSGEQALELARSREAVEDDQSSDFGRARRQQMLVAAIRDRATLTNAFAKAPELMNALQDDLRTDMTLSDLKALYDFGRTLGDSSILHFALTDQNLLENFVPGTPGSCGSLDAYALCPDDGTYAVWQDVFSQLFVDRRILGERAPIQIVNGGGISSDLDQRVAATLGPLGLDVGAGPPGRHAATTVIYDYSGGQYPQTASRLEGFFRATVESPPASPVADGQATTGLVVVLGEDFARRWYGLH